jgi:peptide deformylase
MAVREIVRLDNPVLRKRALKVTSFDASFQKLVDDMIDTLDKAEGVGLAAPQVAVTQRLIIVRLGDDEASREEYGEDAGKLFVFANPEYVKVSRKLVEGVEACLSIPGFFGSVDRHEEVVVRGLDRYGKPQRVKAKGWLARVFQHEIDHLDGRLYIDIASDVWSEKEIEEERAARQAEKAATASAQSPQPES